MTKQTGTIEKQPHAKASFWISPLQHFWESKNYFREFVQRMHIEADTKRKAL